MSDIDTEAYPWELIAEFSNIDEILDLRLVSRSLTECVSRLSPFACASLLHARLVASELSLVSNKTWKKPCQDFIAFLIRRSDASQSTTAFDTMLRTFRTLRYLPMEVAIAYSGKYGRHAIPIKFDSENMAVQSVSYPKCRRSNCSTCRMTIPHDDKRLSDVYKHITIRYKNHHFDLTKFYPKCIPNLPSDLFCPFCRSSGERTLVLSMLSYKSAGLDANNLLTFTPYNDEDYLEAQGDDTDSSADEGTDSLDSPAQKRARHDDVPNDTSFAYPHMYDDCAMPHFDEYSSPDHDNVGKFAISLHCTSCEEFGIVAPARPCIHEDFACDRVATSLDFAGQTSTIGVVLGRTRCRARCHGGKCATLCRSCCLQHKHKPYANHIDQTPLVQSFWCRFCDPEFQLGGYCPRCNWLTTSCHHF